MPVRLTLDISILVLWKLSAFIVLWTRLPNPLTFLAPQNKVYSKDSFKCRPLCPDLSAEHAVLSLWVCGPMQSFAQRGRFCVLPNFGFVIEPGHSSKSNRGRSLGAVLSARLQDCKTWRIKQNGDERRWCPGAYIYAAAVGCWWTYLSSNGHGTETEIYFWAGFLFFKNDINIANIIFNLVPWKMVWNGYSIGNANYHRRFQGKWHWQSIQFIAFFNPSMPGTQWPRVFGTCTATFLRSGWKSLVFHVLSRRFWTDSFQKIRAFFSSALFCTHLWFMAFALEGPFLTWVRSIRRVETV